METKKDLYVRIPPIKRDLICQGISTLFGVISISTNVGIDLSRYIQKKHIVTCGDECDGKIIAIVAEKLFSDIGISRYPRSGGYILKDSIGYCEEMENRYYQVNNHQIIVNHIPFRGIIDFSLDNNIETIICPDAPTLNYLIPSAIRNVVSICANQASYLALHCAAVEKDGDVVLIVGRGRSGKSTLYINLLECGMNPLNDDLVFVKADIDGISVKAIPLYSKLRLSSLPYIKTKIPFPSYDESTTIEHEVYVDCESRYGRLNSMKGRLKSVVFPQINCEKNQIKKVCFSDVKKTLFREIITQQTTVPDSNFIALYNNFIDVPFYKIEISSDVEQASQLLIDFLF